MYSQPYTIHANDLVIIIIVYKSNRYKEQKQSAVGTMVHLAPPSRTPRR